MIMETMISLAFIASNCLVAQAEQYDQVKWEPYNKVIEIKELPDAGVKVKTASRLGGVAKTIKVEPNRMQEVNLVVRGSGKIQVAVFEEGSEMTYLPEEELTEQWKTITLKYFAYSQSLSLYAFSAFNTEGILEIKNVNIKTFPKPEYPDAEIEKAIFEAEDYPGPNGGIVAQEGASANKAVWGENWYRPVSLPTPKTAKPVFIYVRVKANGAPQTSLVVLRDTQHLVKATLTSAKDWQWIKAGPVTTAAMGDSVNLYVSAAKGVRVFIDKIIMSTVAELQSGDLDKAE